MTDNKQVDKLITKAINDNYRANDNGYAAQKLAFWQLDPDGKPFIEVQVKPSRVSIGALHMSMNGGAESGIYELEEVDFTVAEDLSDPMPNRGANYSTSDQNTILINHTLIGSGCAGKKVVLATGLPFSDYFRNGEKNEVLFEKIKKSVLRKVINKSGEEMPIIEEHLIYPESTAAFIDYAFDFQTYELNKPHNGVVIVDMGGETTDVSYITPSLQIDKEKSGSQRIGVLSILAELKQLIANELNVSAESIAPKHVEKALVTGEISFGSTTRDVSNLVHKSKAATAKKLNAYVDSMIGENVFIDAIVFVGGGADALQDHFKKERENVIIPNDPQHSNARGMLIHMTYFR